MEPLSKQPQQSFRRSGLELIHLDVPLISTRRPSSPAGARSPEPRSADTSRRVPFIWERAPGVPKDGLRRPLNSRKGDDFFFFPPKPPPGRRRNPPASADCSSEDDGNDGDVDSCSNGGSAGELEASFPHPSAVNWRESRVLHRSPSFIMNRFLHAANALAASLVPVIPKHRIHRPSSTLPHRIERELLKSRKPQTPAGPVIEKAITVRQPRQPHMSSKACGFQVFFPWTFNQTPCGHKSPVLCQTPGTGAEKSGKKNRRFSFDLLRAKEKVEDDLSSKAYKSPGWGLPFLDTSRLRLRGREDERERGRREFVTGTRGSGKPTWSLPRLHKPSEPWLLQALNNADRRR